MELKQAIMKMARENELEIDDEKLNDMMEAVYLNDDGEEKKQVSRKSIRKAMNEIAMVKELSE